MTSTTRNGLRSVGAGLGCAILAWCCVTACGGDTSGSGGSGTGGTGGGGAGGTGGSTTGGTGGAAGASTGGAAGGGGDICKLPQDSGPCDAAIRRWWFNDATGKCEPFSYGGCEGNANNFQTAMDCVNGCAAGVENACTAIDCPASSVCVYTSPTNATCASPCGDGGACPTGSTCGCGSSCSACKDCLQVCVES